MYADNLELYIPFDLNNQDDQLSAKHVLKHVFMN